MPVLKSHVNNLILYDKDFMIIYLMDSVNKFILREVDLLVNCT